MLKDAARTYYSQGYNCAEALLRAANDRYALGLDERALKTAAGFGGGMGAEKACGALTGAVAALGPMLVEGRAHDAQGFGPLCAAWVARFTQALGGDQCGPLKKLHRRQDGSRCLATVELAAEAFEAFLAERGLSSPAD